MAGPYDDRGCWPRRSGATRVAALRSSVRPGRSRPQCEGEHRGLERAKAGVRPIVDLSPATIERFGQTMRDKLTSGEVPFRKAYIGAIVDRIEVDDHHIRIMGRKDVLEAAVMANGGPVPGVRSIVRKWRHTG